MFRHCRFRAQPIEAVNKVLAEISAEDIEQIIVWNKIDRLTQGELETLKNTDFDFKHEKNIKSTFFVSASTGEGIEEIRNYFAQHPNL